MQQPQSTADEKVSASADCPGGGGHHLGKLVSITRYPVKSMSGEELKEARITSKGLEWDRLYAFESTGAPPGMLRLTSNERRQMLAYAASVDCEGRVFVSTGDVNQFPIDTPNLLNVLQCSANKANKLTLTVSTTPQTDVRPLSILSVQTVEALSSEFGRALDVRRFRANLIFDLHAGAFTEDTLVGRTLAIGSEALVLVRERTPRCRFVTFDPVSPITSDPLFSLMKMLDQRHQGRVGVYASVLRPGQVLLDDRVQLIA